MKHYTLRVRGKVMSENGPKLFHGEARLSSKDPTLVGKVFAGWSEKKAEVYRA